MVQEAIRDLNKKKKATTQSKTAVSTRKDAHPGDNRSMMSQKGKGRKDKCSGFTLQRIASTPMRAPEVTTLEPNEDLFGNIEDSSAGLPTPVAPTTKQAWQEYRTIAAHAQNWHEVNPPPNQTSRRAQTNV
jgi:hypothetical protein